MRNYLITLLSCLLIIACKSQQETRLYNVQIKDSYLYTFKITYFKQLLIKGFNNNDAIRSIVNSDRSGFGEPILTLRDVVLIDSLTKIDSAVMVSDSIKTIGRVAEGAQGKHVFSFALYKFQSRWLDSLAKSQYKLYRRTKKTTTLDDQ